MVVSYDARELFSPSILDCQYGMAIIWQIGFDNGRFNTHLNAINSIQYDMSIEFGFPENYR